MSATIGELCAGYGGLGMGVAQVLDAEVAWYSEIDKGALKILDHRFPGVPNIGDMTSLDWDAVPRVDVLCAGYPCQPFSHAGKRKGTDDSRHLWPHVREAIRHLRPRLTILENVSGHRSLGFDRVLGDLAEDGMHVVWTSLRASDVGAPHRRERLFIGVAPDDDDEGLGGLGRILAERRDPDRRRGEDGPGAPTQPPAFLPSPRTSDTNGAGAHGDDGLDLRTAVTMLPTPRATDGTKGGPNQRGSSGDLMLPSAVTLLPTPSVADGMGGHQTRSGDRSHELLLPGVAAKLLPTPMVGSTSPEAHGQISGQFRAQMAEALSRWGDYADAIARWESLTRPAPEPTMQSKRDTPQLSPAFSEWMMGLPAGWVTDTPGVTRNEALRALGNGVVPQQAVAAVTHLLAHLDGEPTHDRERQEA